MKQSAQRNWKTARIFHHLFISPPSLFASVVYLSPAADLRWGRLIQRGSKLLLASGRPAGTITKPAAAGPLKGHAVHTLTTRTGGSPEHASGKQMDQPAVLFNYYCAIFFPL